MTTAAPAKPKRARTPKPVIDGETKPKRTRVAKPKVETYSIGKTKYKKGAAVLWNWPKAQPTKAKVIGLGTGRDAGKFWIEFEIPIIFRGRDVMVLHKHRAMVFPGSLKAVV